MIDDRGNAVFNASWGTDGGIYARNRADRGMNIDCFATGASVSDQFCPAFSSFPGNTRLIVADGPVSPVNRVLVDGAVVPFSTPLHGFNRADFRNVSVPLERFSFQTLIDYDVTPWANMFIEGIYGRTETSADIEPFAIQTNDIFPTEVFCDTPTSDSDGDGNVTECFNGVALSNPLIPQVIRDEVLARPGNVGRTVDDLRIGFARRLVEVGPRGADAERETFRLLTGLRGDINPDVRFEIALNYARTSDSQFGGGQFNASNVRAAFDAIDLDGNPLTTDDIVCREEAARNEGCVPLDIFSGAGSITPEMLAWIDGVTLRQARNEQTYVTAFLEGDFSTGFLPGEIGWVVGAEHRAESAADVTDALTRTGQNGGNVAPPTFGSFQVSEVFGELQIPLLRDQPFTRDLALNLAARRSTYERGGNELDTHAYAASLEWEPVDGLRFRAQLARAVRAPNVGELFGPPGETFQVVDDPCTGLTLSGGTPAFFNLREDVANPANVFGSGVDASTVGDQVALNCYADPLIKARVDATGGLVLTQSEVQGVGGFIGGGSTDLFEETADTVTLGFVYNAPFDNPWLSGLTFSVDYYRIEIADGVGSLGRQTSADRCYGAPTVGFDPNSAFCANIFRFTAGPSIGALDAIDSNLQNLASIETEGVDYQANWSLNFADAGLLQGTWLGSGEIGVSATYSHLGNYLEEAFPGNGIDDFTDQVGVPRDKGTVHVTYHQGPLTLAWNSAYIGENDIFGGTVDAGFYLIPTTWFHSAQLRFDVTDMHEVYFGVNNVFDEYVFVGGTNQDFGQSVGWTTFPDIYDGVGRRFSVGTRLQF